MKRFVYCLCTLIVCLNTMSQTHYPDSVYVYSDSTYHLKKHPWRAAFETIGVNAVVWGFDRFVMNEEFARISWKTIRNNIKTGFVWDNDQFSTNLFAHPYHGGLYFNTARSNGLSFWESIPYPIAGSLMWEFCGEREPAAINDLIATSIGGIALGELTNRMSLLLLDDSKRGFNRAGREALSFLISPMRGLNRLINGDMWKHRKAHYKYHNYERLPVRFSLTGGDRYLADDSHFFRGEHSPFVKMNMLYGDAFSKTETKPYDYFILSATFNLAGNQPLIGEVNLMSKIWGRQLKTTSGMEMLFGVFQHFNYYDSEEVIDGSGKIPYKISEAASFGPGMIYKFPTVNHYLNLQQNVFVSGILLGGSLTDYYNVIDRNYNMGSGFSIKSQTLLDFGRYGRFGLYLHHYTIYTWKGYKSEELHTTDPLYLNSQGDKGHVQLTVINPVIDLTLIKKLSLNIEASYYLRQTHYKYHPDIHFRTFETRLGLTYSF